MNQPNRVAIALSSIFAGAGSGAALATSCVWAAWHGASMIGDPLIFFGWVGGGILAIIITWLHSPGIVEIWRRAAMSVTAGIGAAAGGGGAGALAIAVQMLPNTVIREAALPAYLLAGVAVAVYSLRINRKHRAIAS